MIKNIKIDLTRNDGFVWFKSEQIQFKGYFFKEDKLYDRTNILDLFKEGNKHLIFSDIIKTANGSFSLIVYSNNYLYVAVDKLRSIPVFYNVENNHINITDCISSETSFIDKQSTKYFEFLSCGYTLGSSTLIDGFKQVEASSYIQVDVSSLVVDKQFYYNHSSSSKIEVSREEHYDRLMDITTSFTEKLIASVKGKTIVVPLSGGYDSRYIVTALRAAGYENVICYTYGHKDSFEIDIAKKVATKLNYKIIVIEYTSQKWIDLYESTNFREYLKYSFNFSSSPHFQDFIAISEISKKKLIPCDSVIVPGFCGDLLGGSYLPIEFLERREKSLRNKNLADYIYENHFVNYKGNIDTIRKNKIVSDINISLHDLSETDLLNDFVSSNEDWFTKHKVAKFIVNSLRVYEYHGYQWRMPLWDDNLINYWYQIPNNLRINNALFNGFLFDRLFKDQDVCYLKSKVLSHNKFMILLRKCIPKSFKLRVKYLYFKLFNINNFDVNNTQQLSSLLGQNCKEILRYKNINGLMSFWITNNN